MLKNAWSSDNENCPKLKSVLGYNLFLPRVIPNKSMFSNNSREGFSSYIFQGSLIKPPEYHKWDPQNIKICQQLKTQMI